MSTGTRTRIDPYLAVGVALFVVVVMAALRAGTMAPFAWLLALTGVVLVIIGAVRRSS